MSDDKHPTAMTFDELLEIARRRWRQLRGEAVGEEWSCGHTAGAMCQECYRLLAARAHELAEENLGVREALQEIETWSRAYPLTVFPEPDLKKAAELLKAGGLTLDAVSASVMRHALDGVGKIVREALK